MDLSKRLILGNKAWVSEMTRINPDYFRTLSADQNPDYLWIGCSDSRVPAEQVTGAKPGEIFVHRNVANLVYPYDVNLMSVLQYAVDALKVDHVIVCGHYGCGGVRASLTSNHFGLLNKWIRGIKETFNRNAEQIESLTTLEEKVNCLVEHSVREQIMNLAKTSIIQKAWANRKAPTLHGWVFDLKSGEVKELLQIDSIESLAPIFRYDTEQLK